MAFYHARNYVIGSQSAWAEEIESQTKLAAVMRNTMGAGKEEVDSILELASAQQKLGVIGDEVQLAGAQELATYLTKKESLEKLMPVMNDMLAQQYGMNASQEQAATIASMMGKVMDGQVGALSRYGYKFTAAQERILKYGTEAQRAATLADVVTSAVGGVNEALANTPEGKLKQHANTMGDLQERVGKLYTQIKAALIPLFEWLGKSLEGVIVWFESNSENIIAIVNGIANAFQVAFEVVGSVISGIVDVFVWWYEKLNEGNAPIAIITVAIGALALAMAAMTLKAKVMAIWSGRITTAKWAWAAAQTGLNLALLTCPLTWIVVGIIALIAIIVFLCVKIDGWKSLWDGVVGFMKYSFMAYVDYVKLYFTTLVNGIMIGLDMIKLGWYKFKEACGLGDSDENKAAIAKINADVESRQQAIVDGAKKIAEDARKAKESLAGIKMSVNDTSLSDVANGLKAKLDIGGGINEQMQEANAGGAGGDGGGGSGGASANAIATGGTRNTQVTITLRNLVENIILQGGVTENSQEITRQVEEAMLRVLYSAQTA
jgi:hypothetical protein